jgi:hypothetical protein
MKLSSLYIYIYVDISDQKLATNIIFGAEMPNLVHQPDAT